MMRVTDRNRERVRGVSLVNHSAGQQAFDHHRDLLLCGSTRANYRFLDHHRPVFRNGKALIGRGQKGDTTRITQLERRRAVSIDIGFFNSRFCGW